MNRERYKNPYFWVGLGGVMLTAMGLRPTDFTTWEHVAYQVQSIIQNPYLLGSTMMAVLGVFVDPTTVGLKDEIKVELVGTEEEMEEIE